MNRFKERPCDARGTTPTGIRARLSRTLTMAVAVAITAVLLPSAISLAKTGQFGRIAVVDAITGSSPDSGKDETQGKQDETGGAPVERTVHKRTTTVALSEADLPKLKDDKSVEARLRANAEKQRRGADDSSDDQASNDGVRHQDTTPGDTTPADTTPADTTPVDDNPSSSDTSAKDDKSSGDDSDDDHGKGDDDGDKHHAAPAPSPVAAPAPSPDAAVTTPVVETQPAAQAPAAAVQPAATDPALDTRRTFELDPTESASLIVDVPEGADHLTLWARAAGIDCAPRLAVTVDGEPTDAGVFALAGTDWQSHVIAPGPDAGVHGIRIVALGTDPQLGCADASQDVVTIVEPKVGAEGDLPPAIDATTATTDAGTATDTGTTDQGSGDATGTTATDPSATTGTTDNGTTDQGSGDATGTTPTDPSATTDNGTIDQGSGDAAGTPTDTTTATDPGVTDTASATTDPRRQFTLFTRESVSLVAAEAADGSPFVLWLRSSSPDCRPRVIVSVDDRVQLVIGLEGTDWQQEVVDAEATGSSHRISIGYLRPRGSCTGTETLTVVEPMGGAEGAATPPAPVTVPGDTSTGTDQGSQPTDNGGSSPSQGSSGGSGSGATGTAKPTTAVFDGSMESATQAFQLVTEGAAAPQRTSTAVRAGSFAEAMTVNPGEKRSELQASDAGGTLKIMPGSTHWFADSIYLAPGFPTTAGVSNGWQTVLQWKDAGGTQSSSPPVSVDIDNGMYTLYGGYGCPGGANEYRVPLAPAKTGIWTDFEFQIHFDTAGQGWVDSYVNGTQVGSRVVPPCGTIYPKPYSEFSMLRVGYYRDPAIKTAGTVIHDEYRMGDTRASVSLYGG